MIADLAPMCQASEAIFLKRWVQSYPRRVNTLTSALARCTWNTIAIELDISWIQRSPFGAFAMEGANAGSIKPG
jgi:hypothetical protein